MELLLCSRRLTTESKDVEVEELQIDRILSTLSEEDVGMQPV